MKRESIRDRILKNLIMFSLVPAILVCSLMVCYVSVDVIHKSRDTIISQMEIQVSHLDELLSQAYQIARVIADDEMVNRELSQGFPNQAEQYRREISLYSELSNMFRFFDDSLKIYIVGENGGLYKSCPDSLKEKDYRQTEWYQSIAKSMQIEWFDLHFISELSDTVDRGFISLAAPILDKQTGKFLGCALIEVHAQELLNFVGNGSVEGETYLFYPDADIRIHDGQVDIYDADRITLICDDHLEDDAQVRAERKDILETTKILSYWTKNFQAEGFKNTAHYAVAYKQLVSNGWFVVFCAKKSDFYSIFRNILPISIFIACLLALIAMYVSYRTSKSLTEPIMALKNGVERVQKGNFEISVQPLKNDEIGDLGRQFNKMVVEIHNLLERIQIENERKRQYELMLLQAQINPHFLYNTLDSLMWLIRMGDGDSAQKMLDALIKFLETGLNKGGDEIFIWQEIENVKSYLTIQMMRYKRKLSFEIQVDEHIGIYRVPKLILQPLVENSVFHGIKAKDEGGVVKVSGCKEGKDIVLIVEDNGLGMETERLIKLRSSLINKDAALTDSYGIMNVNERLQLYFKKGCSFEVDSELNKGTKITIVIKGENYDV